MISKPLSALALIICTATALCTAQTELAVVYEEEGCLRYTADLTNNYLPDFSQAGYRNGNEPLPAVEAVITLQPVDGDNTAHIQAALDEAGALPPDENGIRGAVELGPGTYPVSGTLHIAESGVVLRGAGQGAGPAQNSIIVGTGNSPAERDIILVGDAPGVNWNTEIPGTRSAVTSPYLPAGSRSLQIAAPELYSAGDVIILRHPSTAEWLASINFGGTASDAPWDPGTIDLIYKRTINAVDFAESKVTLDVPIFDRLQRNLAEAEIFVLNEPGIRRQCGVENLRIEIETAGPLDEAHARNAIHLIGVEDCWVKDITALHFTYAAVETETADRVTVQGCSGLQPHSQITGGRRYNFVASRRSNNILFTECHASEGRHAYVSNGTSSVSNVVFHRCTSTRDYNANEGHRRWSQGLLYDQLACTDPQTNILLGLYNRGSYGTGHGWSSVYSVAWNVDIPDANRLLLQRPPGRQNYAIGCKGNITNNHQFIHPLGYVEGSGEELATPSLYEAQLEQRLSSGIAPDAPAQLEAAFVSDAVTLSWRDIAATEEGYIVEASLDEVNYFRIGELPADATEFLDTNTENFGGIISYRVYAQGNGCPSPFSNVAKAATLTNTVAAVIPGVKIAPNPAQDSLWLETGEAQGLVAWIFDARGRLVHQQALSGHQKIDCSGWASGLYFLSLQDQNGRQGVLKFVKK